MKIFPILMALFLVPAVSVWSAGCEVEGSEGDCIAVGSSGCDPGFGENCCGYPDSYCDAEGVCQRI